MKIRTQFMINIVVLGIALLLVSAAVMITNQRAENTRQQAALAAQIEREAYELGYLANDYLLYRESQQASRWEAKFASFSNDLSMMQVNTPEQQALLARIKTNRQRLEAVFIEVVASNEGMPPAQEAGFDEKFMQVSWSRLEVQNQGMIFDVSRLERMLGEQEHRLERLNSLFGFLLIGILGVFLLVNYGLTFRRILQAIANLQDGTRIIGSGDLEYAIPVENEDEIGELSRAFNQMTASLKEVTASKADLERETAEREQAESRLQVVMENSPDPIFLKDRDSRLLLANPATFAVIGKPAEAVLGKTDAEFYDDPATGRAIIENDRRIIDSGRVEVVEESITDEKGTRVFLSTKAPYCDPEGQVIGLVGVARDITERKRAEQEIESLSRFPAENPYPVLRAWYDGRLAYANAASQELLEMWDCEVDGYLSEEMKDLITVTVDSDTHKTVEIPCHDKVYVITLVPVKGSGYINLYGSDITARKQTEDVLRQREEELREAQRISHIGNWYWDAKTDVTTGSDELLRIYGFDPATQAMPDFKEQRERCYPVEDWERINAAVQETVETGRGYKLDVRAYRNGETIWVTTRSEVVRDAGRQIIGLRGTVQDITERKRAEEELRRTLYELKRSNAELEEFAYVASHDLQEPLRGIAGFAELLGQRYQGKLDSRADEYISIIFDGTQRMQALINDLLAYSRVGRRGKAIQTTSAGSALEAALQNLSAALREYGANVTYDCLPTVRADATQLIQLFQNLIGNAIKFHSDCPPHIHIGVTDARDCWQFSVSDNGIGIEPQFFERIFQVFQRLHTRREYKGNGIGLAICKKIIERHGGGIWVESEPGAGSTFYFTLPKGA